MWYYLFGNKQYGPVDEEKIRELMEIKIINGQTKVWRTGMQNWLPLEKTELAGIRLNKLVSQSSFSNFPIQKKHYKVVRGRLNQLYTWWLITFCMTILFYFLNFIVVVFSINVVKAAIYSLSCIFEISIITNSVLFFVLLYKFWAAIQDGRAITSPEKAVGLSLIPIYYLYWNFYSFWGLSKALNQYIDAHIASTLSKETHRSKSWISLLFVIFTTVTSLAIHIFVVSYLLTANISLESFLRVKITYPTWYLATNYPVSIIFYILQLIMYSDFIKTTESILKVESKDKQNHPK